MRIEAKAALLPLVLGALLSPAAAQRVITDQSSPKAAPAKTHSKPAARPEAKPAPGAAAPRSSKSAKSARKPGARRPDPLADRLLDEDEGLHVIASALGAHIRHASGDDCSQLVHEVYQRAGFSYPYANSWELYDGTSEFHRVWTPQPGDLVVWQGHVGIVVSPKEHLFFSKLTSTGQDIASYDTSYWQSRGRPRFFRYLKPEEGIERAAAPARQRKPVARELAEAKPERKPAPRQVAEARLERDPIPTVVVDASPDPGPAPAPAERHEAAAALLLNARRPMPEQVCQAILKELLSAAPALSDAQAPALSQPLIVFDDLRVERVTLDGDQGWAEVRIHQVGVVNGGRAEVGKRTQRAFWSLHRRDGDDWEIVTPMQTTYLPRKAAVPVIAHQLAMLNDDADAPAAGAPQKKSLARLLDMLLEP